MASAAPAPEDIPQRDLLWTRTTIVILSGAGMLGLLILAASAGREFTAVLGIGLIVSGAAFTVGGLIGFLFAIPRCSTGIQRTRACWSAPGVRMEQTSEYLVAISGDYSLEHVNLALASEEAGASEFRGARIETSGGKLVNAARFGPLPPGTVPPPLRIVRADEPAPPGAQRLWSGTMAVHGTPTPVVVYRDSRTRSGSLS